MVTVGNNTSLYILKLLRECKLKVPIQKKNNLELCVVMDVN